VDALALGFREEVVLTPSDGFVTHAQPDFVYALGPGPTGRVLVRLGSFFGDQRREIDVVSLHVFGYGRAT
jgi:hypothetical protein